MKFDVMRPLAAAALSLGFLALAGANAGRAQDVLEVAPQVYTKLLENNRLRVLEGRFRPGEKVPVHSQPEHLFYALSAGTLVVRQQGRTAYEMTFEPGQTLLLPAQSRALENATNEAVRTLIVEFKNAPAAKAVPKRRVKRSTRPRA